jgi:predicted Kef-type K+ transport protein
VSLPAVSVFLLETYNVILAAALISIALNPLLFRLAVYAGKTQPTEEEKTA